MDRQNAISVLNMVEAHGLANEAKEEAIKALDTMIKLEKLINDPLVKASGSVSTAKIRGILV